MHRDLGFCRDGQLPLHSSRRDLEPSVRQDLIRYVGYAASNSKAPTAAVGGESAIPQEAEAVIGLSQAPSLVGGLIRW
jgi:hypothetical protein